MSLATFYAPSAYPPATIFFSHMCASLVECFLITQKNSGNIFPEHITININFKFIPYLLSSRLYCRLRSYTESAKLLAGYTAGRDFHPALKIFFIYFYYIFFTFFCIWLNCYIFRQKNTPFQTYQIPKITLKLYRFFIKFFFLYYSSFLGIHFPFHAYSAIKAAPIAHEIGYAM